MEKRSHAPKETKVCRYCDGVNTKDCPIHGTPGD